MSDTPPTQGIGRPDGRPQTVQRFADGSELHPTDGLDWLKCDVCDATWLGEPDDPCTWCADALRRQTEWQAELLLTPPEIDPDNRNHDNVMLAWAQRLKRGVEAGLVADTQASYAWERTVTRGAAA